MLPMAGPLSSEEIEDVVSSVRRLVSNEQRVLTRDLNAERLVLTSVYRVVPETSPLSPLMLNAPVAEAPPAPAAAAADMAREASAPQGADPLEDSLAQALAVDVEPELTGEGDDLTSPSRPAASMTDTVEGEWEDEIWAEPGQVSLGEVALAAEEAEVLMAPEPEGIQPLAEEGVAPQPDATDSTWADAPIPFVPLRRRAEDLAARVAAGAVVEPPAAVAAPAEGDPVSEAAPLESAPEEPKEAPDTAEALDAAAESEAVVAPSPEPAADPQPATASQAAPPLMATDLYDADGTPLAVLDETALSEIVRQVLRAELQGELGERITRNVRKLVRAEINRALLARDLD
jgi:hypothetical protein